ncbi:inositol monophosphatase [Halioglobus maricola]|uniref:Inositol monophosphatase n=1 Tax=Halioglobus maricola TaxID=2601894 RepID=A0A5P9NPM5_9GAMM|nr:inositol monophosphatase family protein [Halioglobus maricola]QFU77405.1 inositol monophosphatase [Halioglobus maricola]
MPIDHQRIGEIIRQAANEHVLPLWRNLQQDQIEEKQRGDFVTVADKASEAFLTPELANLLPGSLVVGEEAVHADPGLMASLDSEHPVWVIDPVDGTANFAAGKTPFAVMVCLMQQGQSLAGWIYDPVAETMLQAERGAGAFLDGERLQFGEPSGVAGDINGALSTKYLPEEMRPFTLRGAGHLGHTQSSGCAAYDYRAMARGDYSFSFYYRTMIWDHAPGTLVVEEMGGMVARYDGSPYLPAVEAYGLISASDPDTWHTVRRLLVEAQPGAY